MYEVNCLDLDGNTINNFFQWDIDQKIMIELKGCNANYLKITPEAHFTNVKREEAFVVRAAVLGTVCVENANVMSSPSEISNIKGTLHMDDEVECTSIGNNWYEIKYNGDNAYIEASCVSNKETIVAEVPNILFQEPYPLLIYVYLTDSQDVSSQKTILYSEIPVRKRAKPKDYLYVENITRITAEIIKRELEATTKSTVQNAIQEITNAKDDSINTVNQKKEDFIATGQSLVDSATAIKEDTQQTYEDAVIIAEQTQEQIESDINTMMLENGLVLKTSNDGNGNVTLAVIIDQS